jgi:hypothetical protein
MKFGFTTISQEAIDKLRSLDILVRKEDGQWTVTAQTKEDYVGDSAVRVWKNPDNSCYYYLVRGVIFKMIPIQIIEFINGNRTTTEESRLILADQQEYRGVLEETRPPVMERMI